MTSDQYSVLSLKFSYVPPLAYRSYCNQTLCSTRLRFTENFLILVSVKSVHKIRDKASWGLWGNYLVEDFILCFKLVHMLSSMPKVNFNSLYAILGGAEIRTWVYTLHENLSTQKYIYIYTNLIGLAQDLHLISQIR